MMKRSMVRRITSLLLAMLCAFCMQTAFAEPENAAVDLSRAKSAAVAEASSLSIVLAKEADAKLDVAGLARLPVFSCLRVGHVLLVADFMLQAGPPVHGYGAQLHLHLPCGGQLRS